MAIDHSRDFWSNATFDPTDPATTSVAYFVTRWITHLCAPWFVLLAGVGAALSLQRGRDVRGLTKFLLSRGAWLVVLELTILNLAWKGSSYDPTFLRVMVLCVLGASMIVLAGLVHLPRWAIAAFAVALIVGHGAFERHGGWLTTLLHAPGVIGARPHAGLSVFVLYPLVPWIGVMALGYCIGPWLARQRARTYALLGVALLAAFVVMRGIDAYGDPQPWEVMPSRVQTVMSFLQLSKYPPSLDFLLATFGAGLLVLAAIAATRDLGAWNVLRTFGRVPLFFYLVHVALISGSWELLHRLATGTWRSDLGAWWGFSLPVVYAAWAAYIVVLYLPCRWFEGVKARRRDWWLGYL